MKVLSEKRALERLAMLRKSFAAHIRSEYEHAAKDCVTCETKGACCLDTHFVNVRITRLEAVAIMSEINSLPTEKREAVRERISDAVERFGLDDAAESVGRTYACPLFERQSGCLVHETAKPLPCIAHACYERKEDLPPESLLDELEIKVCDLSRRTYSSAAFTRSLPAALKKLF